VTFTSLVGLDTRHAYHCRARPTICAAHTHSAGVWHHTIPPRALPSSRVTAPPRGAAPPRHHAPLRARCLPRLRLPHLPPAAATTPPCAPAYHRLPLPACLLRGRRLPALPAVRRHHMHPPTATPGALCRAPLPTLLRLVPLARGACQRLYRNAGGIAYCATAPHRPAIACAGYAHTTQPATLPLHCHPTRAPHFPPTTLIPFLPYPPLTPVPRCMRERCCPCPTTTMPYSYHYLPSTTAPVPAHTCHCASPSPPPPPPPTSHTFFFLLPDLYHVKVPVPCWTACTFWVCLPMTTTTPTYRPSWAHLRRGRATAAQPASSTPGRQWEGDKQEGACRAAFTAGYSVQKNDAAAGGKRRRPACLTSRASGGRIRLY